MADLTYKATKALIDLFTKLLLLTAPEPPDGRNFPVVVCLPFQSHNAKHAKSAVQAARSRKPWLYNGKNYRITAIYVENNYLFIRGIDMAATPG